MLQMMFSFVAAISSAYPRLLLLVNTSVLVNTCKLLVGEFLIKNLTVCL